ncbi:Arm DNA-binding domain-containing protein [Acinetobacter terrestris]
MGIGAYPTINLADARRVLEEFKELIAQNIDSAIEHKV